MTATWTDSHCHLQEQFLDADDTATSQVRQALERAHEASVSSIVVVGTDEATSLQALALAGASRDGAFGHDAPKIAATVGLHPHDAAADIAWLHEMLELHHDEVVGIGECGFDYFYEHADRGLQRTTFLDQIALAKQYDKALVIHARDAWDDLFTALDELGTPERTVLHCFTGGPDEAQACLDRGMFVSFSGIVTFKNAAATRAALSVVPDDRLLIETDAPFLAPVPHRGKKNEPALVGVVGGFVAAERGVSEAHIAAVTSANAAVAFALSQNPF